MERHLEQLCNENPLLLTTIQNAIFSGYERSRDFVRQCGGNSISDFRVGYVRHASIEPLIFRAVEEAGFLALRHYAAIITEEQRNILKFKRLGLF